MSKIIAALAPFLSLSADADEATVLNRLSALPKDATLEDLTAAADEVTELRNRHDALLDAQVEADLDRFENEGLISDRESVKAMLLHNRESTLKMLNGLKPPEGKAPERVYNRATAKPPQKNVDELNAEHDKAEAARASKIHNRATEIANKDGLPWSRAWNLASSEIPAE